MRMSSRERILLMLMIMVVAGWVSFSYLIEDQLQQIYDNSTEIRLQKAELQRLRALILKEPEIDEAIAVSYEGIQEVAGDYFNTTAQEERILLLNDFLLMPFIEESAIAFHEPQIVDIQGLTFQKDSVTIGIGGQYSSLINMLKTIWQFPKQIEVSNLGLTSAGFDEVSGNITLDFYTFAAESGVVDDLYKWYIDDLFYRQNPFAAVEDNGIIVRYLYLQDEELFNYSQYFEYTDIDGHWAQTEIEEFLDYGYLYLNPYLTFEPDEPVTRGEFIVMLDSIYQWETPYDDEVDLTDFRDYEDLGSLEGAFAKAVHKGFLSGFVEGYDDRTLRPRDPISYREVEFLMARVKEVDGFLWQSVASSLEWRKTHYDQRWDDLDNTLTRAEAVYLLYYYK